jgi:hypothetical protein
MGTQHTKKCPACGQWGPWQQRDTDRCTHCGALLDPRSLQEREDREEYERKHKEDSFFTPRATDGVLMRITRKVAFAAYIVYTAVVAFIMYIVTSLVG